MKCFSHDNHILRTLLKGFDVFGIRLKFEDRDCFNDMLSSWSSEGGPLEDSIH